MKMYEEWGRGRVTGERERMGLCPEKSGEIESSWLDRLA
jgi:hypothetical protein